MHTHSHEFPCTLLTLHLPSSVKSWKSTTTAWPPLPRRPCCLPSALFVASASLSPPPSRLLLTYRGVLQREQAQVVSAHAASCAVCLVCCCNCCFRSRTLCFLLLPAATSSPSSSESSSKLSYLCCVCVCGCVCVCATSNETTTAGSSKKFQTNNQLDQRSYNSIIH